MIRRRSPVSPIYSDNGPVLARRGRDAGPLANQAFALARRIARIVQDPLKLLDVLGLAALAMALLSVIVMRE